MLKRRMRVRSAASYSGEELQREHYRRIADDARDGGDWMTAACNYLEMLRENPEDVGILMQHGHMLKELGLFAAAGKSYSKALELAPSDPEIHLQIGFLAKLQGDFVAASSCLQLALANGYKDPELINRELHALRHVVRPSQTFSGRSGGRAPYRLLLSSIVDLPVTEGSSELRRDLGAAHYSYAFSMKGYVSALETLGEDYGVLQSPEYISNAVERFGGSVNLHIGFYPPEHVRLLKGAYNILSLAWEFERLKLPSELTSYQAFADPVKAMARVDEIWSVCSYTTEVLQRHGLSNVKTVPSPVAVTKRRPRNGRPSWHDLDGNAGRMKHIRWIPLAIGTPVIQGTLNQQAYQRQRSLGDILAVGACEDPPIIFLSVFNVHDYRKQIRPMIEAFLQINARIRNCYLLLKVSANGQSNEVINGIMLKEQLSDPGSLAPSFVSDRIWMTCDVLSREEMN